MHATSNPHLWSYARACRRLAEQIEPCGDNGFSAETAAPALEHLRQAAAELSALANVHDAGLPSGLLENVLLAELDEAASADAGVDGDSAPGTDHQQELSATGDLAVPADLLSFLSSLRRTGILEVVTATERFELELLDGDVVHAQSDGAPEGERLGDICVELGLVSREVVEKTRQAAADKRLGLALWRHGALSQEQLVTALEEQIRRLFARLFAVSAERYTFWSGPPIRAQEHLRMNTTGLILDSARTADERSRDQ